MQALLFLLIFILIIWIIIRETGLLNRIFPYKKISIMDLAEFSWIPSIVKDNWDKKILNDVIPDLKKDTDVKTLNDSIDNIHKMYKEGNIQVDQSKDKPTSGTKSTYSIRIDEALDMFKNVVRDTTSKDGVSGYSVRV